MRNFAIEFQYPWLLLLLIPAFALTAFLYFRLNKKFRKTRNRIVSIVLHCIVMVLCISVLAGIRFTYELADLENEIILLVDVSETEARSADVRDEFVRTVLRESGYDGYKVGVVTFGFTQEYAVPLTYDTDGIFETYLAAPQPDTTATDVAAALQFAQGLFENPETAKIVLITDGKETDESAASAVLPIARKGIVVDTVCVPSSFDEDNVQVIGIAYPDYHINCGEEFNLNVELRCKAPSPATTVRLYDNGVLAEGMTQVVDLAAGSSAVTFRLAFAEEGLHEIGVEVSADGDRLEKNNAYCSYYYLEVFGHVLIIEHKTGESEALKGLLSEQNIYANNVEVLDLSNYEVLPQSAEELRRYDQIILNNVSNGDFAALPVPESSQDGEDWFVQMLYSYVYDYGGGLFTVGGKEEKDGKITAHAYNREDLYDTLYQDLLPVEAIDYTPPVGVMLIIDISGSMGDGTEGTPLYYAKEGARNCLYALTDRDYMGIMTLDSVYGMVLPLTSRTEETKIREAIYGIGTGGNTVFSSAIKTAGENLRRLQNVDKRHIVIVTDGMPSEEDTESYLAVANDLYQRSGITISVVGVGIEPASTTYEKMKELTDTAGGITHTASGQELLDEMYNDLNAPMIKEFNYESFRPTVNDPFSPLLSGVEYGTDSENRKMLDVTLDGFFGVKKRESAELILMGDYGVPIYAQWKFGKGMVGSFLCDLDGSDTSWSKDFMADENGKRFLLNAVATLMPTENIRPNEIKLDLREENYFNMLNIYTDLSDGQRLEGKLIEITDEGEIEHSMSYVEGTEWGGDLYITTYLGAENRFTRFGFVIKRSGIYKIVVEKYGEDGALIASAEEYKTFSYSAEYDSFAEEEESAALLSTIADRGNGSVIAADDPWGVFSSFVDSLSRTYDPRLAFIITAMVLFLLDIAVRKFKFKWIHELVREHRAKKAESRR